MSNHLSPLGPELDDLLTAERQTPSPSRDSKQRVTDRLLVSTGGAYRKVELPHGSRRARVSSVDALAPSSSEAGLFAAITGKPALLASLAFALGVGSGFGVHALIDDDAKAPTPTITVTETAPTPAPAPAAAPATPSPATETERPGSRDRDLAAERSSIERARGALARKDAQSALAALREHRSRFPRGGLSEERDALQVQALVRAGRPERARKRAAQFNTRYPSSLFGPVVDAAIESAP